jgi:hypothetical protein
MLDVNSFLAISVVALLYRILLLSKALEPEFKTTCIYIFAQLSAWYLNKHA